jgi:hypothetical protein
LKWSPEVYILKKNPPPRERRISANLIWGKKYERWMRKRGICEGKRKKDRRKKGKLNLKE